MSEFRQEYKPNSHKSKEESPKPAEKKKVEKVVTGVVKTKKNELRKFTDIFISEDVSNVKNYIFMDVLVPAIKKAVSDIVTNGIDMILYGDSGRNRRNTNASGVSYRSYYDQRREDERRYSSVPVSRTRYSYDDIILNTRGEAEEVLARMDELIDTYGIASVADLYDLVGLTGDYTDNKYGWTNIRSAEVVRDRDGGYRLKMPKALPIN